MNKIREKRLSKKITQSDLAEMLGLTQGIISSWECGRNKPSMKAARRLSIALGCTLDELFGDEVEESEEGK